MSDENDMEKARELTIEILLGQKRAYIIAGANPLKHMDQLQTRLRIAARTSASVEEWVSQMAQKLGLGAPDNALSSTIDELREHVLETIGQTSWLDLLEREHGYLMAMTRVEYDQAQGEKGVR